MRKIICLIALLTGLVFSFYHLTIPYLWKMPNYSPLVLNENAPSFTVDETIAYAAKVREILDGHFRLSDIYLWEYKNQPSPLLGEFFPAVIMAGLAKISGGITQDFIVADFIFPSLIFLGLSYLIGSLTNKKWLAIPGALITMFFSHYLSYYPYLPSVVGLIIKGLFNGAYSDFIRSFHPQITFNLWLIITIIIWQIIKQGKLSVKKIFLLAGILGLTAYSYIFYWTYAVTWTGLVFLGMFFSKKFKLSIDIFKTLLLAGILTIPYLINLWQFQKSPLSQDFIAGLSSFTPLSIKTLFLILGLIGLNCLLIKEKTVIFFWLSFYSAGLILFVIAKPLGFTINDPIGHWLMRVIYPMATINLVTIILKLAKQDYHRWAIGLAGGLLIYQGICHWQYFKKNAAVFHLEAERKEAFNWININLNPEDVIVTTSLLDNLYLPVYTSVNIFIPWTQYTIASDQEGIERFLMIYKLAEIPEKRVQEMFEFTETNKQYAIKKRSKYEDCGGTYFYFLKFSKDQPYSHYNCSVDPDQLKKILVEYEQIKVNLKTIKNKYRADYWLWGPNENQWARVNPDQLGWQKLWQNQSYSIYRLPEAIE